HVDRPERLHAALHHRLVRRLVGRVDLNRRRLSPGRLHQLRGLRRRLPIQIGDTHVRPLLREPHRARPSDPTPTPCNQRDLPLDPSRHRSPPESCSESLRSSRLSLRPKSLPVKCALPDARKPSNVAAPEAKTRSVHAWDTWTEGSRSSPEPVDCAGSAGRPGSRSRVKAPTWW